MLHSLEAAARLAGVPRRSFLVYCRAGLVHPVWQPPYGVMQFTEEAVHTARRIRHFHAARTGDLVWVKSMLDMVNEVESLRAELRFLRKS